MWLPQRISLGGEMGYHERLLSMIMDGTIADSRGLVSAKVALAREFGLGRVPSNSETLAMADEGMLAKAGPLLRRKPMRTRSGVAVVAVMTSPAPCPHGKCSYCPGGVDNGSPQSYTGKEPAARRAVANDFDPFRQVTNRLGQLESIGHPTDKVDLIIMGGTFTSREKEYQLSFVKGCFDGLNGEGSRSLEEAHRKNELSPHRCIGMTVETRPDQFDDAKASFSMGLGATRVELGVQILAEGLLSHHAWPARIKPGQGRGTILHDLRGREVQAGHDQDLPDSSREGHGLVRDVEERRIRALHDRAGR